MAGPKTYRVSYNSVEAFELNGRKVEDIIQKDTGRPVAQSKSLPPQIFPVVLTEDAVTKLKELSGVDVTELDYE